MQFRNKFIRHILRKLIISRNFGYYFKLLEEKRGKLLVITCKRHLLNTRKKMSETINSH